MKHEGNRADPGTNDSRHGDGPDQRARWGIERSIRPGSPVPPTVLVAEMGDGALLLQGWRIGPSAISPLKTRCRCAKHESPHSAATRQESRFPSTR